MTIEVFLVDDHEVVRSGLQMLLESEPEVAIVGNAASAVRTASVMTPQLRSWT